VLISFLYTLHPEEGSLGSARGGGTMHCL
jgi:hypothetical protein